MSAENALGENLLRLKEEAGWSWERMARELARVTKKEVPSGSTLYRYATGKCQPRSGVLASFIRDAVYRARMELAESALRESREAQERALEALRESEERYRHIFEGCPIGVGVSSVDGRLILANRAMERITGYSLEELKRIPLADVYEDPQDRRRLVEAVKRDGKVTDFPVRLKRKDGARYDAVLNVSLVRMGRQKVFHVACRDVAEQKRIEEELREGQAKYRNLFEYSAVPMSKSDESGRFTLVNREFEALTGYTGEELTDGMSISDLVAEEDLPRVLKYHRRRRKGEQVPIRYRTTIVRKDGERRAVVISVGLIPGSDADVAILEDVTAQERVETELRASEEQYRNLVDNAVVGVYATNLKGDILYVNRELQRMLKFKSAEEVKRESVQARYRRPEDRAVFIEALKKDGEIRGFETQLLTKDGESRYAILSGVLSGDEITGMIMDITKRKLAEQALAESEAKFRELAESISEVFFAMDEDFRYTYWNRASEVLTGIRREDAIGKSLFELFPEFKGTAAAEFYRTVLHTKKPGSFINEFALQGRNRVFELNASPTAEGISVFARDITERKQAEGELLRHQQQLRSLASELSLAEERERRRLAAELHDTVGHALAFLSMKLDAIAEPASSAGLAAPLQEIRGIVGKTIDETRSLTFEISPPILYQLGLEPALEWLAERFSKRYGIPCGYADDGKAKPLDDDVRVLVFQSVRELLVNVAKHAQAKRAKVSAERDVDDMYVAVEDDGVGLDTSKLNPQGVATSGFGLFSIRERLEHIGGYSEIVSRPGQGTRVTIVVPLKPGSHRRRTQ